jgi:hypothetical protein
MVYDQWRVVLNEEFIAEMIARAVVYGVVRPCTIQTYLSESTRSRALRRMVRSGFLVRISKQKYAPGKRLSSIIEREP